MNFKVNLTLFFAFLAIVLSFVALYKSNYPNAHAGEKKESGEEPTIVKEAAAKIEVAHFMNRIQVFHNKLYYAGINENAELAQFYLDEMEEEMGEIAEAGVFDVDANISENIVTYGLKQIEWLRNQIKIDFSGFKSDFDQLTNSCNSCHVVVKKDFIKIGVPQTPIFTNQIYTP